MTRRRKAFLGAITALFLASPLAAEPSDQALIDGAIGPLGDAENLKLLDYTARCVVEKYPLAADTFVRDTTDATAMVKDKARLLDENCIKAYWFRSSTTSYEPGVYRVILAEALIGLAQQDKSLSLAVADAAATDQPQLPAVPVSEVHPYYRPMFVVDRHEAQLSQFADCAVRSRPEAVLALLATKRGSAEEAAALADVESAPAECAAKRPSVSFPAFARRGELALHLYLLSRLSGAPAPKPMPKRRR